ncbi:MAG: HK97 family phage prohead protease [Phycisphaerae bacterium]|nr:HK97 family phage prohead protease [Phycisphaerae bacterium]
MNTTGILSINEIRDATAAKPPQRERRMLPAAEVRVVKTDDGKTHLQGYAAVFNQPSVPLTTAKGVKFIEQISPGAFRDSLASNPDIPMLLAHDPKKVLARTGSQTLELREDEKGLAFDAVMPDTTMARDLVADVEHGNVKGMSFGFDSPEDSWEKGDDLPTRTLLKVPLGEVSATPFPAYTETSIDVRSIDEALAKLEGRAIVAAQDRSIQFYCRWGLDDLRSAFDTVQGIIAGLSQYQPEQLEDADKQAMADFADQAELLADKLDQLDTAITALVPDSEPDPDGDPTANPPPEVIGEQQNDASSTLKRLMQIQRAAETGLRTAELRATEHRDGHMTHSGAVALNATGINTAQRCVDTGDIIDSDDEDWEWSDDDQERSAQAGGASHLAIRSDVGVGKQQYVYPCVRNGKLHMEALRSICREAGKNGAQNVADTATDLLAKAKAKRDDDGE